MKLIRSLNLGLTAFGITVFGLVFIFLNVFSHSFNQRTQDFAISKIETQFENTLPNMSNSETADRLSDFSGKISKDLEAQVDDARKSLREGRDVFIADILAAACRLDCERREMARQSVKRYYEDKIEKYGIAIDRVENLVVGKYDQVMSELRRDLSIFSGTNLMALILAFLLSLIKGQAARHILPISIILTFATSIMVYWYVFGQNWVMTIVFNNYLGWSYAIVLSTLVLFLLDIAFNKARITSAVFNGICNAIGSSISFLPC